MPRWEPAYWSEDGEWLIIGHSGTIPEAYFEQINEAPIVIGVIKKR